MSSACPCLMRKCHLRRSNRPGTPISVKMSVIFLGPVDICGVRPPVPTSQAGARCLV